MDRQWDSAPRQEALQKVLADSATGDAENQSATPLGPRLYFNPPFPQWCTGDGLPWTGFVTMCLTHIGIRALGSTFQKRDTTRPRWPSDRQAIAADSICEVERGEWEERYQHRLQCCGMVSNCYGGRRCRICISFINSTRLAPVTEESIQPTACTHPATWSLSQTRCAGLVQKHFAFDVFDAGPWLVAGPRDLSSACNARASQGIGSG